MSAKRILVSLLLLGLGAAAGAFSARYYAQLRPEAGPAPPAREEAGAGAAGRKVLYWTDPMIPGYRSDKPGTSPMGMELVPVYADEGPEEGGLRISPAVVNNLGVRTAKVERGTLYRQIDTVGFVDYDARKVSHVHTRAVGWIEDLRVRYEGERVRQGDVLFRLFSPELVKAQQEFLQVLKGNLPGLAEAARGQLRALGIPEPVIARMEKEGRVERLMDFTAPQDGVVSDLPVREGMYVDPSMTVVGLADLSSVWVVADLFDIQAPWVKVGQRAEVRLPFLPNRTWEGAVEFVYPSLDPKTRTLRVRLRLANPGEELKPQMFAAVTIYGEPRADTLSVPRDSVIRTGKTSRVIKALGGGRFQPADIETGVEAGERIEVRKGLAEGEAVVVQAQFLLDSESSLSAEMRRIDSGAPVGPSAAPGDAARARAADEPPAAVEAEASGTVVKLDAAARRVTISHGPIAVIGWPAMTMGFAAAPEVDLTQVKAGDKVIFRLREKPDGSFEIVAIARAKP